jgi:hypothetical protein
MWAPCATNKCLHATKNKWKILLNKMKRSQDKDWVLTNKEEINSFLQYYCCKALCWSLRWAIIFLVIGCWQRPFFTRRWQKRGFFLS